MAWVEIPNADIDVGSYAREDTVFQRLRSNLRELRVALFAWIFAEQSSTSSSWTALTSTRVEVFVPNVASYSGLARKVQATIDYKQAGATSIDVRLADVASAATGTELTGLTATGYTAINPELAIDSGWVGTVRTFEVQVRVNGGGTGYVQSPSRVAGRVHY